MSQTVVYQKRKEKLNLSSQLGRNAKILYVVPSKFSKSK